MSTAKSIPFFLSTFVSGLLPLYVIIVVKTASFELGASYWISTIASGLFFLFCTFASIDFLRNIENPSNVGISVSRENKSSDLINYIIPYIFALVGDINFTDPRDLFSLLFFIAILGIMSYRGGTSILNPTLALLGYKLFRAKFKIGEHEKEYTVITKSHLEKDEKFGLKNIVADLYIAIPYEQIKTK